MFALSREWTYLNHGSYGATFKLALDAQAWLRYEMEAQPVLFMESTALDGVARAAAQLAPLVGADWRDLVPITNATGGINAVVNSLELGPGDLLVMANTTYPAVRSVLARAAARTGASLVDVAFTIDSLTDEGAIVDAFREAAALGGGGGGGGGAGRSGGGGGGRRARGGRVRLAVVDHCVSFPPVVMPVARICGALRALGVPVLVDGAHALGAFAALDVPALGCDYYVSNAHKWLCSPKGCAFLWAARRRQAGLRPLVTSHGCGLGFRGEFLWAGTTDPTPWLCVPACLAAVERLGGFAAVAAYNHALVCAAAELLRARWGVREPALGARRDGGGTAGLAAVALPAPLLAPPPPDGDGAPAAAGAGGGGGGGLLPCTPEGAQRLQRHLRAAWRVEVPVACVEGRLWCRVSAQVYNTLPQYEKLAEAVAQLRPPPGA
ncbi:MAG: PLP-dependent transferase [Monoraphidium minutum]|nr:MAG: PLP-dependent transferase [Monoraphidium minutum]